MHTYRLDTQLEKGILCSSPQYFTRLHSLQCSIMAYSTTTASTRVSVCHVKARAGHFLQSGGPKRGNIYTTPPLKQMTSLPVSLSSWTPFTLCLRPTLSEWFTDTFPAIGYTAASWQQRFAGARPLFCLAFGRGRDLMKNSVWYHLESVSIFSLFSCFMVCSSPVAATDTTTSSFCRCFYYNY